MDKRSRTVLFSISSNALLLTVKLLAGIVTGSVSVLSEAVHSATDLVASIVAFVAVRGSVSPPDEAHNYGHGRFENLAGVFEGVILLGVGGWVIFGAIDNIVNGAELELLGLGIGGDGPLVAREPVRLRLALAGGPRDGLSGSGGRGVQRAH